MATLGGYLGECGGDTGKVRVKLWGEKVAQLVDPAIRLVAVYHGYKAGNSRFGFEARTNNKETVQPNHL